VAAIMPDQVPEHGGSVVVPFLGQPALTMTLVRGILRRFDVTPLLAYAVREPDGRFRVHFEEPPAGLGDDDPARAATQLNQGIGQCVRAHPEQYLWTYNRFRGHRRMAGKPVLASTGGEPTPV
jgi:KDO2-lipid IV(A) lauroyltransferase